MTDDLRDVLARIADPRPKTDPEWRQLRTDARAILLADENADDIESLERCLQQTITAEVMNMIVDYRCRGANVISTSMPFSVQYAPLLITSLRAEGWKREPKEPIR